VGTIDCIAVISARMKGWKTRTFTDMVCMHHRKVGTAQCGPLRARYNAGVMDYTMGNHPLWQAFRVMYQMGQKPYAIRGLAIGAGYFWALLRRRKRAVPDELVKFVRREQMQRLKNKLTGRVQPEKRVMLAQGGAHHPQ
jgi:hypothetical protein